jgi:hypothetical protein
MGGSRIATLIAAALTVAAVALVVALFLVKILWAWVIPDLFPGAVAQGLVAGSISWYTSLKVAIFLAVLTALFRSDPDGGRRGTHGHGG